MSFCCACYDHRAEINWHQAKKIVILLAKLIWQDFKIT